MLMIIITVIIIIKIIIILINNNNNSRSYDNVYNNNTNCYILFIQFTFFSFDWLSGRYVTSNYCCQQLNCLL